MISGLPSWVPGRALFWMALTAATALLSRWFSTTMLAYPRVREAGAAAACDPAAARDEQRLADTPVWRLAERWLADRALQPFRVAPGFTPLRILNVDFGPGGVAIALREKAPLDATIIATDSVAGMGDLAWHRALQRTPRRQPRFMRAWSYSLPFRDGAFDLVVASGTLHGWPNPETVLAEIKRVLKPDGRYLVADLRRDIKVPLWLVLRLGQALFVPGNLRALDEPSSSIRSAYAPHEAEWLAARAGLPDIAVRSWPLGVMIERKWAESPAS
jgi:ubiquinone/menaquinone biosynthesis C-methylase UbiE